jgi:pimeloyl-ACP methyl ester carboxylesterase
MRSRLRVPASPLLQGPAAILGLTARPPQHDELPARRDTPALSSEPPPGLPEGRLLHVRRHGEIFLRDTGGDGPPVLLLHGWMFPSDLNWFRVYRPLARAGYRVIALDCRGHGRGLRSVRSFRLEDCAADAAALVRALGCGPVTVVGYSMGGAIAQLIARDHPRQLSGMVLCATSREWRDPRMRLLWNGMGLLRLWIEIFPRDFWRWTLRAAGFPDSPTTSWIASELSRGSPLDIAEAGREIGRFDSRQWIERVSVPASVIVTTEDYAVPPLKQYELACSLRAPVHEIACDHNGVLVKQQNFARTVIRAIRALPTPVAGPREAPEASAIGARAHGRPRRVAPAPAPRRRATA